MALSDTMIIVAGATGDLGFRIAQALRRRDAAVRAVVRIGSAPERLRALRGLGAEVAEVDTRSARDMAAACAGGHCVVSALSGLREVIVDAQTVLLDAAVRAGIPRFIPSDFSADYLRLPAGRNRNFDLRREFQGRLQGVRIGATTIFNGGFSDLLIGQAPIVLRQARRVIYWSDPDQRLDFTTRDDTASFTAAAALDASAPRVVRIAGDQLSARELAAAASRVTGRTFRLTRAGSVATLRGLIVATRAVAPRRQDVFPAWQGMQYLENMFSGLVALDALDNGRYPGIGWTTVEQVLASG